MSSEQRALCIEEYDVALLAYCRMLRCVSEFTEQIGDGEVVDATSLSFYMSRAKEMEALLLEKRNELSLTGGIILSELITFENCTFKNGVLKGSSFEAVMNRAKTWVSAFEYEDGKDCTLYEVGQYITHY